MKLYYTPGTCSLAVHIALRELGIAFEGVAVDLAKHTTRDGADYFDISPRGYVPLLELDDGTRHTEVNALLEYVADQDPRQALIGPIGSARRLAVTEWLAFVATGLHKTFSPWLFDPNSADSTCQAVKAKQAVRFAELDQLLARQDYLAGDFSVADAYAFAIVSWANVVGVPLQPFAHLSDYLTHVSQRPHVREALLAEGLAK